MKWLLWPGMLACRVTGPGDPEGCQILRMWVNTAAWGAVGAVAVAITMR